MSGCGCNNNSTTTPSTAERLPNAANTGRGGYGVKVDADFVAGSLVNQVLVYPPATSPPASITVVFPLNPTEGQKLEVVAAGIAVVVDGNTNNITGSTSLASGNSKTWTFTRNAFDPDLSQPGNWIPEV